MPFAGTIKLKHFLLAVGGVGLLGGAALLFLSGGDDTVDTPTVGVSNTKTPETLPEKQPMSNDSAESVAFSWQGRALSSKKKKDVSSGKPFKINVYQDAGKSTVNRLKIDLDRDDKWDEKWTFSGDKVSRKKSSNDDENYDLQQEWQGNTWK
ncbi:MAG: hypothetical protein VX278_21415 [Myxococcota bacterium]|nr:hypothetical protein [Myxococcota bacterium]